MQLIDTIIENYPVWVKKFDEKLNYSLRKKLKLMKDPKTTAGGKNIEILKEEQKKEIEKIEEDFRKQEANLFEDN